VAISEVNIEITVGASEILNFDLRSNRVFPTWQAALPASERLNLKRLMPLNAVLTASSAEHFRLNRPAADISPHEEEAEVSKRS
jgi:hypothetical protein